MSSPLVAMRIGWSALELRGRVRRPRPSPSVVVVSNPVERRTVTPSTGAPVRRSVAQTVALVASDSASTPSEVDCAHVSDGRFVQ